MASDTILLVEDDESVLTTMQAILELDGYTVTAVAQGTQALALLRERHYDLVLTDLRMEDIDGLTVLAEVQRTAPETVAIMLTGYASLESAVKALREGAYAYLIKPCNVDELRATVARGMERRHLTSQLRERVQQLEVANGTIRRLNADLQERVDAATAQLTAQMADLARAKAEIDSLYAAATQHVEQLEEFDRLKSQFLSMASHELRTPLTSISGYLQMALRRARRRLERGYPGPEEWESDIRLDMQEGETLTNQTRRLNRLVGELLDVSRIETGRVEFRPAAVDLQRLTEEVVRRAQGDAPLHQLSVLPANGDTTIQGDSDHLEQVLTNLISNAIKYSPDGGPISVAFDVTAEQVVLRVQDQGIGIPPDQQQHVFSLFYRSPDAKTRHAGGMGLGLYISNEIVKRHSGQMRVVSTPGVGSTFLVTLPRWALTTDPAPPA